MGLKVLKTVSVVRTVSLKRTLVLIEIEDAATMASESQMASLLATAGVPAFKCPPGTKMHLLDLGTLQADEGW
jgi:hypothetical protein